MSVEQIAADVRRRVSAHGFYAAVRWCANQGYKPEWVVNVLAGRV